MGYQGHLRFKHSAFVIQSMLAARSPQKLEEARVCAPPLQRASEQMNKDTNTDDQLYQGMCREYRELSVRFIISIDALSCSNDSEETHYHLANPKTIIQTVFHYHYLMIGNLR